MKFDHRSFSLSLNAWLGALFLIIFIYNYYYISLYPRLNGQYQDGFWNSEYAVPVMNQNAKQKDESTISGLKFKIKYPKYLASYDFSDLEVTVLNDSESELSGYLSIVGDVFTPYNNLSSHNILLASVVEGTIGSSVYNYSIHYDLQPKTSEVYLVKVKAPSIDNSMHELVSFRFENRPTPNSRANVMSVISESTTQNSCKPYIEELIEFKSIDKKYIVQFCAEVNSIEVFRQSVIRKLLLPPWSNVLLPIFGAGIVWFVEIHLEGKRRRSSFNSQEPFSLEGFVNIVIPSIVLLFLVRSVLWAVLLPANNFTAFNETYARLLMLLPLLVLLLPPITVRLLTITVSLTGFVSKVLRSFFINIEPTWVGESIASTLEDRIRKLWNTSDYQALKKAKEEVDKMLDGDLPLRTRFKEFLWGGNSETEKLKVKQDLLIKRLLILEEKLNNQLERIRELVNTDISMPKFWENYRSAYELASKCPHYVSDGNWFYDEVVESKEVKDMIIQTLTDRLKAKLSSLIEDEERLVFLMQANDEIESFPLAERKLISSRPVNNNEPDDLKDLKNFIHRQIESLQARESVNTNTDVSVKEKP